MVVVRVWEGLGNQLFQYAYARALQLRTGRKVYLDYNRCYREELEGHRIRRTYGLSHFCVKLCSYDKTEKLFFFMKNKTFIDKTIFYFSQKRHGLFCFYREDSVEYKKELLNIGNGIYYIMGWFQNEKYFKEYRTQLLRELRPKECIKISHYLKNILVNENTVSIHIRRCDYRSGNNQLPIFYYENAINVIEKKIDCPYYLVFTDDVKWARQYFSQLERCYYVIDENLQDYEELWVMSKCKHNIIANSTFSWWGAWLNCNKDKLVIGPEKWFLSGNNKMINIMPEEWIRVSVNTFSDKERM